MWRPTTYGPGSDDPEVWVLGSLLDISNERSLDETREVAAFLEPEDFSQPYRQIAWRTMLELADDGTPPHYTAVLPKLCENGDAEACTRDDLRALWLEAYTSAYVVEWAKHVKRMAVVRAIQGHANRAAKDGHNLEAELHAADARIAEISDFRRERGTTPADALGALTRELRRSGEASSLMSGLEPLDEQAGALRPGDLCIVGARTSTGKTAFALTLFEHLAVNGGQPGLFFSLEMPQAQIALRLACMRAESPFSFSRALDGKLSPPELEDLDHALAELDEGPGTWFVHDEPSITWRDVLTVAKRHQRAHGLRFIVVDYLQLMKGAERSESREREVAESSAGLKRVAMELEVPVIALAQVNRRADLRDGKKPGLSDLRDSGSIEQDADRVILLWRPEGSHNPDEAFAIVAKNRNGACGNVELRYRGPRMRWEAPPEQYPGQWER